MKIQTELKTEAALRTAQDRDNAKTPRDSRTAPDAAMALETILSGGNWDQLPAEGMLELSHTVGNGALLDILSMRKELPEAQAFPLPAGECGTVPVYAEGGMPLAVHSPQFGSMPPMGESAPLQI